MRIEQLRETEEHRPTPAADFDGVTRVDALRALLVKHDFDLAKQKELERDRPIVMQALGFVSALFVLVLGVAPSVAAQETPQARAAAAMASLDSPANFNKRPPPVTTFGVSTGYRWWYEAQRFPLRVKENYYETWRGSFVQEARGVYHRGSFDPYLYGGFRSDQDRSQPSSRRDQRGYAGVARRTSRRP